MSKLHQDLERLMKKLLGDSCKKVTVKDVRQHPFADGISTVYGEIATDETVLQFVLPVSDVVEVKK